MLQVVKYIIFFTCKFLTGFYWVVLQIKAEDRKIYSYSALEGPAPNYTNTDQHYAHFQQPLAIIGNTYSVTIAFFSDRAEYEVEGLGKITRKFPTLAAPLSDFRNIGTRSTNGEGPCTVFVDDVYVLRP